MVGNAVVRRCDHPAGVRALALPAGPPAGRLARTPRALSGRARSCELARPAALLQLSVAADRQSRGRFADRALVKIVRARAGGETDRHDHPAADRCRLPVGRARSSQPLAADRAVRIAIRIRPSVPVRLRQLCAVDGACLPRLRAVAPTRAVESDRPSRVIVRANLVPALHHPHLRLGYARTARLFGRGGAPA